MNSSPLNAEHGRTGLGVLLLSPLPPPRQPAAAPTRIPGSSSSEMQSPLPPRQLNNADLIDLMRADGGDVVPGLAGPARAIGALAAPRQLTPDERAQTFAAAEEHMTVVNKKLDILDLQVSNIYTAHHALKVDLVHVKARVLAQVIWSADATLMPLEDGQARTRSPTAWAEVMRLTKTSSVKCARDCATGIIGASVAWRLCESVRPKIMAELSTGVFTLDEFTKCARRCISLRLSYSQASGLTPVGARITMKNDGQFDFSALVDEAAAASVERANRNRARTLRLRELVIAMRADPAGPARQEIADGLRMRSADEVLDALPDAAAYGEPMPDRLTAMLTPEEQARVGGPTRATAVAAVAGAGDVAAMTPPGSAAGRRGGKRVASAGHQGGGGGRTPVQRRPRLAGPDPSTSSGDGGGSEGDGVSDTNNDVATAAAPATAAAAARPVLVCNGGVALVLAPAEVASPDGVVHVPAAADESAATVAAIDNTDKAATALPAAAAASAGGVVRLSAAFVDGTATATAVHAAADNTSNAATALPAFVDKPASSNAAPLDYLARVPDGMFSFALGLMRAADEFKLVVGGNNPICDGDFGRACVGLFCAMAGAFDDAALLAEHICGGGSGVFAPNRHLIKNDNRLLGLGLGMCFTSFALIEHGNLAPDAPDHVHNMGAARAVGTTVVSVFFNAGGSDDSGDGSKPHAFELARRGGGGGQERFELRHGTVLVSRAGGTPWAVERVSSGAKLTELRLFVSRRLALRVAGPSYLLPPCSARSVVQRFVADGVASRSEAVAMFARV